MHFIDSTNFERLLKKLSGEGELFVPVRNEDSGKLMLSRVEEFPLPENVCFDGYRTVEPLKGFAQLLRSPVAEYPSADSDEMADPGAFPTYIVAGARACDVISLGLIDRVQVEGEFTDPFYKIRRDKMLLIAADCSECGESCFCTLLGNKPWPEKDFDLSIAKVSGGFVIDSGSDRGAAVLEQNQELLTETRDAQIKARDEIRERVAKELEQKNKDFPAADKLPEVIREALGDEVWGEISAKCVECGACTNICPTCYCFLLFDQKMDGEHFQRILSWDSCQVTGYARMAGMLNPRPRLTDRVKHRYYHKYDYLVLSHGAIYCTGCGRCIDTCSAGIDMRESFKKVKDKAKR